MNVDAQIVGMVVGDETRFVWRDEIAARRSTIARPLDLRPATRARRSSAAPAASPLRREHFGTTRAPMRSPGPRCRPRHVMVDQAPPARSLNHATIALSARQQAVERAVGLRRNCTERSMVSAVPLGGSPRSHRAVMGPRRSRPHRTRPTFSTHRDVSSAAPSRPSRHAELVVVARLKRSRRNRVGGVH